METNILGIHHVTAIAGDPQQNLEFYAGVLGLRLVKRTINYDDPGAYHLYYGDGLGRPGTILTFFPWAGVPRGHPGTGQVTAIALSVPETALPYWQARLVRFGAPVEPPVDRFGQRVVHFSDPDGLPLELVADNGTDMREGWQDGPVPAEHTIRGVQGVSLSETAYQRTASLLTETLGFQPVQDAEGRFRFEVGEGGPGAQVDVLHQPDVPFGRIAVGSVHHIAWRTLDDAQQAAWREKLVRLGAGVSPVMDRQYFHSIYFREPGGVLFEIATDPPGFTTDETPDELGTGLRLPSWLEGQRARIEASLPPVRLPDPEEWR